LRVNEREIGVRNVMSVLVVVVIEVIAANQDGRVEQDVLQK
jgi:hypothetical protein